MQALESLQRALEGLKDVTLPLSELADLLAQLLENETIRPKKSREHGIAVIIMKMQWAWNLIGLVFVA